jgi:hypothetical protein
MYDVQKTVKYYVDVEMPVRKSNHSPFFGEGGFLGLAGFLRVERRIEKRRKELFLLDSPSGRGRLRRLCLCSDKLLCIRRIATPPSSVAKSNPRWTERSPVDISVRLPVRGSGGGLLSRVMTLSAREAIETGRDLGRDVDRRIDVDRLIECDRLMAAKGAAKYASCPRSRSGFCLRFHLTMSISSGI